jgi:hypothetical protein
VETLGIAVVFLIMLALPCAIAMRSSQKASDMDGQEMEDLPEPEVEFVFEDTLGRPLTLTELAVRAESDAIVARELAREAQVAALSAAAHAARLRADAAIEAAKAADMANQAAMAEYLPGDHPSLDFPRSRVRRRAA